MDDVPRVFISYSHDNQTHKDWVHELAENLVKNGVDTVLDQWNLSLGEDVAAFMEKHVTSVDRVLMVCTDKYIEKANAGTGGVGYEKMIVTAELMAKLDSKRFIPLIRNVKGPKKLPTFLGTRLYIDLSDEADQEQNFDTLLRELHAKPARKKPALGKCPFGDKTELPGTTTFDTTQPLTEKPIRSTDPTGVTRAGISVLSDTWFENERSIAERGIAAVGLTAHMEIRLGLHDGISKSQIELLNAVKKSQIQTFGWPIGVTLENREEYRPRPYGDGIRAEVSIKDGLSYDYWATRKNGDFYLLQSLFEDSRREGEVFFNTRIVRVTEALLFASNLYTNLSVPPVAKLSARVAHRGISGRRLTSSNPSRYIHPRKSREANSEAEVVLQLGLIQESLVDDLERICGPLFLLFDFQQFDREIYNDIVRRFKKGDVS